MKVIVAGVVLAMTVTAAPAQDRQSAAYILPGCRHLVEGTKPATDLFVQGLCAGMVYGIVRMTGSRVNSILQFLEHEGDPLNRDNPLSNGLRSLMCMDPGKGQSSVGQMVGVVIAYIEARPERMREPFADLAFEAFNEAWPCK